MDYKKYMIDELEKQNLFYDPKQSPYVKLFSEEELTEKEIGQILTKIGSSPYVINQKLGHIKNLVSLFEKHLIYTDYDKAEFVFSEVSTYDDFLPYTSFKRHADLLKVRYFLARNQYDKAKKIIRLLKKERNLFSPLEELLFEYLQGVLEMLIGNFEAANTRLDYVIRNTSTLYGFEGEVYYHLSIVKTYLEEPSRAIYYGKKALDYLSQQYNYKRILHAQMSLAINCAYAKIYEDAIEYYDHLLRNSQLLNQDDLLPHIYHNMGDLYYKMQNFSMALAYFNMAINHYGDHDVSYASCLYNLGLTELELNKNQDAMYTFNKLKDVAEKLDLANYKLYTEFYLLDLNDQHEQAMQFLEEQVVPYTSNTPGEQAHHLIFSNKLVLHYKEKGNFEKAFQYITEEKYNVE